ncbi:MAG: hypothetical protein WC717_00855 [Candidatus Micrarchaeia archaeon]|jgi:hypothetical protein
MDTNRIACGVAVFLIIAFASCALYLFGENAALSGRMGSLNATFSSRLAQSQSDYALLSSRYAVSQSQLGAASAELGNASASIASLQSRLLQTENALSASKESLAGQQQEADKLREELSGLELTLNSSIAWFRENARLPHDYSWISDPNQERVMQGFVPRLLSDCVDGGSLNLACISHLMENTAFSIHYRSDIVSGSIDHLQSVKETMGLGWGDCEDYSLIFKAILNSLREENASLAAVAWQPAENSDFRVYPKYTPGESETYWAYRNAKAARLGALSHAYVVCYSVDAASGHCTVALSGEDVQESSQVPLLHGAEVFEPQNGRYLGRIGESLSICAGSGCRSVGGRIWLVIADSDLYMYGEGGWQGYADYLSRVQGISGQPALQ